MHDLTISQPVILVCHYEFVVIKLVNSVDFNSYFHDVLVKK